MAAESSNSNVLDSYPEDNAWGLTHRANIELWQAKLAAAAHRLELLLPSGLLQNGAAAGQPAQVDLAAMAALEGKATAGELWSLIHYGESMFLKAFIGGGHGSPAATQATNFAGVLEQLASKHLSNCSAKHSALSSTDKRETQARALWQLAEAEAIAAEITLGRVLLLMKSRAWLKIIFPLKDSWGHYERAHRLTQDPLFAVHQDRLFGSSAAQPRSGLIDSAEAEAEHIEAEALPTGYVERALASRVLFGVGLFQFGGSLLPPTFLWIAEALGFQGDRKLALSALKTAAGNRQCTRWLPANMLLAGYAWYFSGEKGETMAAEAMERLRLELRPSAILEMVAGHICRRFGKLDEAQHHFQAVIDTAQEIEQFQITAAYEMSNVNWLRGEYDLCAQGVQAYLDRSTNQAYRCYGAYKLGFCLWKTRGPLPETLASIAELYQRVPSWGDAKMSHDRYAIRKTQQWLQHRVFDRFELEWIPANAAYQGCNYQRALDLLVNVVAIVKDKSIPAILPLKDRLAMCFYLRGCAYAGLKNYQEAAANFQNLFQLEEAVEIEQWVIPYGFVETADLFIGKRNPRKAIEYLDKARNFPRAYDLDKPLSFRIKKLQTMAERLNSPPQ